MKIADKHYTTIWLKDSHTVQIINQQKLPHIFEIVDLQCLDDFVVAIKEMQVRGAPLIGVTAAWGMYIASITGELARAAEKLIATRPTARNLQWAVERMAKADDFLKEAEAITQEDIMQCKAIGEHGANIIEQISNDKGKINILTHCNAGWLACVDYGTALAPIYNAYEKGIDIHVWVDETRPRNQGANLTAWELGQHGVPHTLVADNAGGHLMQQGLVDIVIVGADRVTKTGDVANKIGTYLKALAAKDNNIPFYVAVPSTTFDPDATSVVIEERDENEVRYVSGLTPRGVQEVLICPETTKASNYGFDVTPARLITGLITERGINERGLHQIFFKTQNC